MIFSDFFREIFGNLEKSRNCWISLDFPLHFHANVKENQAKSDIFEIFQDFPEQNLKNNEKYNFSKSPKYFSLYFRV